jgi:hypothetical protein
MMVELYILFRAVKETASNELLYFLESLLVMFMLS